MPSELATAAATIEMRIYIEESMSYYDDDFE